MPLARRLKTSGMPWPCTSCSTTSDEFIKRCASPRRWKRVYRIMSGPSKKLLRLLMYRISESILSKQCLELDNALELVADCCYDTIYCSQRGEVSSSPCCMLKVVGEKKPAGKTGL